MCYRFFNLSHVKRQEGARSIRDALMCSQQYTAFRNNERILQLLNIERERNENPADTR